MPHFPFFSCSRHLRLASWLGMRQMLLTGLSSIVGRGLLLANGEYVWSCTFSCMSLMSRVGASLRLSARSNPWVLYGQSNIVRLWYAIFSCTP